MYAAVQPPGLKPASLHSSPVLCHVCGPPHLEQHLTLSNTWAYLVCLKPCGYGADITGLHTTRRTSSARYRWACQYFYFCCYELQLVTESLPSNTLPLLEVSTHSKSPHYFSTSFWKGVSTPVCGLRASFGSEATSPARYPVEAVAISTNFLQKHSCQDVSCRQIISHWKSLWKFTFPLEVVKHLKSVTKRRFWNGSSDYFQGIFIIPLAFKQLYFA